MALAQEEQGRAAVITNGRMLQGMHGVLRALYSYQKNPEVLELENPAQGRICLLEAPSHGAWKYDNGGVSDNFYDRVRFCVAEAGRVLPGYPNGADPEDFWLHQLYFHLKGKNDLVSCWGENSGMILSVCVASATFCARLGRQGVKDARESSSAVGRPRKDEERKLVRRKHADGKSWKQIAQEMNHETNQEKTAEAYRKLLRINPAVQK